MSDSLILHLQKDVGDIEPRFALVEEGVYTVKAANASHEDDVRVSMEYEILDDGPFAGHRLFQRYDVTHEVGKSLFKELLFAIEVHPKGRKLDLLQCVNKVLRVTVKHNRRHGRTYANVVAHHIADSTMTD